MIKRSKLIHGKVLLACAVAAALIGMSVPAGTNAHWVYTNQASGTQTQWLTHDGNFLTAATNYPTGGGRGRMYGYTPDIWYNLAVRVNCQGYGTTSWTQDFKKGPWAIYRYCPNGAQAIWTQGGFAE